MDKTAIKNFAIEARKVLMKSAVTEAGFYGITKDGCSSPKQRGVDFEVYETVAGTENRIFGNDIKRRVNLVKAINEHGFDQVIEETAYTWFNRIIAIRFMEVNNYLPSRVRVLSAEAGGTTPDIISQSDSVGLNLSDEEREIIRTAKRENRYDDAFRMLFVRQCNDLNDILPGLFEKTDDYMELLLKITYTGDGVIRMLVDSVPESNFNVETEGQVEIIGWMYQYYNTELKDDTFAKLKKNIKITKERIPSATQLFTPDWIVRYMVENSLGRVWIEHLRAVDPSVDEKAKAEEFGWKYYLPEAEQEETVEVQLEKIRKQNNNLTPQDITCIDPCMGSGHILVYMFDVLMDIYRSEGFSEREAVFDILEKNIRGLDIDRRAYQLSYFALMMKARGYNRIFFRGREDIDGNRVQAAPRVYAIEESNSIERDQLQYYGADLDETQKNNAINQMNGLLDTLHDAKEYGSILNVENYDWKLLHSFVDSFDNDGQMSLVGFAAGRSQNLLNELITVGEVLARKYNVVATNPPYMGIRGGMNERLYDFVTNYYPNSKIDLYSVFIEKCGELAKKNGYYAMITQQGWMFLTGSSNLRGIVLTNDFINMAHLGPRAFDEISGEVVQSTSFVLRKTDVNEYKATFLRLLEGQSEKEKENLFFNSRKYVISKDKFLDLHEKPIAYWLSPQFFKAFKNDVLEKVAKPRQGMATSNNERFLRLWFEIDNNMIKFDAKDEEEAEGSGKKWFPYNKGGGFRKWYGNNDYLINWEHNGREVKELAVALYKCVTRTIKNIKFYFRKGITWSTLASGSFNARLCDNGFLFDTKGSTCYLDNEDYIPYILGYLNCNVANEFLKVLAPTLDYNAGSIAKLPIKIDEGRMPQIAECTKVCVEISKEDWDSFEVSWDFDEHPIVRISKELWDATAIGASMQYYYGNHPKVSCPVELCYMLWQGECNERFRKLKENEEALNRIFIEIYGLQDEMTPAVEDKDITIRKADLGKDIRSLISYAVGCMFGRYSLAKAGLVFAGGVFDKAQYGSFSVDEDAIIPITDEPYFDDDIVKRFEEFISLVFGADSLESNLEFIADALGTKGENTREKIRNYFLNDFFKDHCNTYSVTGSGKRPIYWLFDSGKQNGFKCLIYLHRYHKDMVGIIRSDYLTKVQSAIEVALKNAEYTINTTQSAVDRAGATKRRDKYVKQLAEIKAYYPALSHIALQKIDLDLDDGVKNNYTKFQGIEVSVEGEKKQTIDLLARL